LPPRSHSGARCSGAEENLIPTITRRFFRSWLLLAAASLACVGIVASATARDGDRPVYPTFGANPGFGDQVLMLGWAEAVEEREVAAALQQIAALHELAALQTLADLANWPEPYIEPAPAAAARAPVPRAPAAQPPAQPRSWTDATFSAAVLGEVNARRTGYGLAPLRADGRITQASTSYAQRMISSGSFGHSVDGSTLTSRLTAAGFSEPVMLGEVIAYGGGGFSPASIVEMWMNSPSHREQILSSNYWRGGAGCAFSGSDVKCVVNMAG
jgi:uncharacterized protein YkwD